MDSFDWALAGTRGPTASEPLSCGVLPACRHDFLEHVVAEVRGARQRGGVVPMHETRDIGLDGLDAPIVKLRAEGDPFSTPAAQAFEALLR